MDKIFPWTVWKWTVSGSSDSNLIDIGIAMKLFESVQKYFRTLGIRPPESSEKSSYNFLNSMVLLVLVTGSIFTMAFCLFKAITVREYGDSFYASVTEMANTVYLLSNIWKMRTIFNVITRLEEFIQKRKWFFFLSVQWISNVFTSFPTIELWHQHFSCMKYNWTTKT